MCAPALKTATDTSWQIWCSNKPVTSNICSSKQEAVLKEIIMIIKVPNTTPLPLNFRVRTCNMQRVSVNVITITQTRLRGAKADSQARSPHRTLTELSPRPVCEDEFHSNKVAAIFFSLCCNLNVKNALQLGDVRRSIHLKLGLVVSSFFGVFFPGGPSQGSLQRLLPHFITALRTAICSRIKMRLSDFLSAGRINEMSDFKSPHVCHISLGGNLRPFTSYVVQ